MDKLTIKQYSKLLDTFEYDIFLNALKPLNLFCGNKLDYNKITYAEVRKLFHLANTGKTLDDMCDMFCIAFNIEKGVFWSGNIDEYFSAKNFIIKYLKDTQEKESKLLNSIDADAGLWEQAGGNSLNVFSDLMPLVQLGEIYGVYPYDLQHKPYNEILTLLVLHSKKNQVQNKFNELKMKQK
jgi:hypothetical protein